MNDNLLTQIVKRSEKFMKTLMGSENSVVKYLYHISQENTHSVINTNISLLNSMDAPIIADDDVVHTAAQIYELNMCLDGFSDCGLNGDQIKEILDYISTL